MQKTAFVFLAAFLHLSAAAGAPDIQVIAPLSFGGLLVQPYGGRVTLTANGSLLPEGGGILPGAAPMAAYARIHLRGPANGHFRLRIDPAIPVLNGAFGGALQVAAFRSSLTNLEGRFDGTGDTEVTLGGTLDIPAGTPAGPYATMVNLQLNVDGCPGVIHPLGVTCTVRSPLTLTNLASLDFAAITPGGGGIFRVDAAAGHTEGGQGPRLVKGSPHPASFRLTGPVHAPYTIILPLEAVLTGPRGTLRVIDFTSDQKQGVLPSQGLTFHVGAGLDVKADQPLGAYKGVFRVTVAYQ